MQYEQRRPRRAHRAAEALDRHRHGPRAHRRACCRACTTTTTSTSSRRSIAAVAMAGDRRAGDGRAPRPSHRVIADHLRATSFLIADGVLPSQRRPRLRAAPHHAPRHAPRAPARRRGAADVPAGADAGAARWATPIPSCSARRAAHRRDAAAEEKRFRQTLERGMGLLDEATGEPQEGRRAVRRDGLQALRHLRLPARPHRRTRCAPRGITVDTGASTRPWSAQKRRRPRKAWTGSGEAATETVWFEVTEQARRHRVPRLRHARRAGRGARHREGRQARSTALKAGDEAALVLEPDAVLRRDAAARSATPASSRAPRARGSASPTRRSRLGDVFVHIGDASRRARFKAGRCASSWSSTTTAARHPRQPLGDPPAARGAAPGARRRTWRRRARWWRPTGCASTSRTTAGDARGDGARSRTWSTPIVPQNAPVETRLMALEEAMETGRAWRCSARSTATRCASCRWAGESAGRPSGRPTRPGRSSCAAARTCARTGDIGLVQDRRRKRQSPRACAASRR